jgi:SpoVK/Ycf46/Vps4 family AAA+-type ATPase
VGLDQIQSQVLQRLECCWDGAWWEWSRRTVTSLPAPLAARFSDALTLVVLSGDPGIGKSALAQSIACTYCQMTGQEGHFYWLTTAARGDGTVGNFSQQLRAAFAEVEQAAASGPSFLLIDEADALAMARTERQSHSEEKAATATLLQLLDQLGGRKVAVFMTTNLLARVDSAIQRRALCFALRRPDMAARKVLLQQWLPDASEPILRRAAQAADRMTPVDIERALEAFYLESLSADTAPDLSSLPARLRRATRTSTV